MQSNLLVAILVALCLATAAYGFELKSKSKNEVKFSHEILEVVAGILDISLQGTINTDDSEKNTLGAFVNIAGKTFPLFQSMGLTEKKLEFSEKSCWNWGWNQGCFGFQFEFYVGWEIVDGNAKDFQFLNVTYVPYVTGEGGLFVNSESWAIKLDGDLNSKFVNIRVPIGTQFNFANNLQFCYDANAYIIDPSLIMSFTSSVKSCQADMAENIIQETFEYACSYGSPIEVVIVNNTNVPVTFYSLIGRQCITLYDPK